MGVLGVFIRHPILAIMLNLAMMTAGMFAYTRLNVDQMPQVNIITVRVTTRWDGATPDQIESQITKPIEDAVAVIGGLDELSSTSSQGVSEVNVKFLLGVDGDSATQQVRDKVEPVMDRFPPGAKAPNYAQIPADDTPILQLCVSSRRPIRELTDIAQYQVAQPLQRLTGVGEIKIYGGRKRTVQIELSAELLAKFQLPVTAVQQAVTGFATQVPGGHVVSQTNDYVLSLASKLPTPEAFGDIIVTDFADRQLQNPGNVTDYYTEPVRVSDLGRASDGEADWETNSRLNGEPAITLSLKKTSDANVLNVIDAVTDQLKELRKTLPSDVTVRIVQNNAIETQRAVADLQEDLLLGAGLASLTVLIFLGNLRLTFIAALAIPTSLITTFAVMAALNYTLNYMTLLALSLAVGIVIDDAVVVLENIYKVMNERGLTPLQAAQEGLSEIAFAVMATTLSLVVLFLPLAFMPGEVGLYFRAWGVVMASTIAISLVVSFTLTPVLCAQLLKPQQSPPKTELLTRWIQRAYAVILRVALRLRWLVVLLAVLTAVAGLHLLVVVGKDFITKDDKGSYFVELKLPPGWPMPRSSEELLYIEKELQKLPYVQDVLMTAEDASNAVIFVQLVPWSQRQPHTEFDCLAQARAMLLRYPHARVSVTTLYNNQDFEYDIVGPELAPLAELANRMRDQLTHVPGFVDVDTTLTVGIPQVRVELDPQRAADLDVDPESALQSVSLLIGGLKIATWQSGDRSYDVRLRLFPEDRDEPDDVLHAWVPTTNPQQRLVELGDVAAVSTSLGPGPIPRFQRQRQVAVLANLLPGHSLQEANSKGDKVFKSLKPPPGYTEAVTGDSKLLQQTAVAALQSFVLSVLFMYMVMASQFENLLDPVLILATLPMAIPFALLSLVWAGMTLNLFSVLGLFLLFGVVKKNAILQIDQTNHLLRQGLPVREAILQANEERVRPILMTTITMVVAMLPVAFAGPTGAARAPMAMVVVGGQTMCLLLTLILVPVMTSILEDFKAFVRRWRR